MKRLTRMLILFTVILTIFMSFSFTALAGNTGKIKGVVTDQTTGEPIPSATVMLVGTNMGAMTDIDGNYLITEGATLEYIVTE